MGPGKLLPDRKGLRMRIIIYHDDADGRCAAAIAGLDARLEGRDPVVFLPMDYGAAVDWARFSAFDIQADEVWIVDFSLPPDDMVRLKVLCSGKLVWIDHHVTAIEKLAAFAGVKGKRDIGRAACLLTWEYCQMVAPPPLAVQLIGDRDTWTFALGDKSRWFHEAFFLEDTAPQRAVWDRWLSHTYDCRKELESGVVLYERKKKSSRNLLERLGRVEKLHGTELSVLTANCMGTGDLGETAREMGYDVLHCYVEKVQDGRLVRVHNLYSEKVDVGELAKIRGGGGHREAAGWVEVVK